MGQSQLFIALADLLHPENVMKTFPYAAGCVGAYALAELGDRARGEVFRAPEDLGATFREDPPQVLGLTNYIWNLELGYEVIRQAKARVPGLVVVMGGPNYPGDAEEQALFFRRYPLVDFHVCKEGEIAFLELIEALLAADLDVAECKRARLRIPGVHYLAGDELVAPAPAPRQRELNDLPSPYLSGLLDKFFARKDLTPLLQTKRGCPFQCTFCVEGEDYYSKIGSVTTERFRAELEYIAARMAGGVPLLHIADSNFGMYAHDLELCDVIADVRERTGWPETVEVSTGKNRKERVLEAVRRTNGAMRFGPALQSTNKATLENVKRSNISEDSLLDMARAAGAMGQRSYTELILGLPGDTPQAHRQSIRASMDGGIQRIKMYPLVLLPGTELAEAAARARFGLQARFRVLPYCHGVYSFLEPDFASAEICELVVGTSEMSFAEYLETKRFELSVEIFYNDGYLEEIHGLLRALGLSLYEFVERCHEAQRGFSEELRMLYGSIDRGVSGYLFDSREQCLEHFRDPARLREYAADEYKNSLGTLKAIALLEHIDAVLEIAHAALRDCIRAAGLETPALAQYVGELIVYSRLRRSRILETDLRPEGMFHFAFDRMLEGGFRSHPYEFRLSEARRMRFWHDAGQTQGIRRLRTEVDNPIVRARSFIYPQSDPGVNPYLRRSDFC